MRMLQRHSGLHFLALAMASCLLAFVVTPLRAQDNNHAIPAAQNTGPGAQPPLEDKCSPKHLDQCIRDIGRDQEGIWTSPARIRAHQLEWIVPFTVATIVAIHYDHQALVDLGKSPSRVNFGTNASRFGAWYSLTGASAGLYAIGHYSHHHKLSETGMRSMEAMADALVVTEGIKLATERDRPSQDTDLEGEFWPHGLRSYNFDSSFPSGHAAASWAFAHVFAQEYSNHKWVGLVAYAGASMVCVSRVLAQQHFPTDVLVGGAIGYLSGGYVVRHRTEENRRRLKVSLSPAIDPATGGFGMTLNISREAGSPGSSPDLGGDSGAGTPPR